MFYFRMSYLIIIYYFNIGNTKKAEVDLMKFNHNKSRVW